MARATRRLPRLPDRILKAGQQRIPPLPSHQHVAGLKRLPHPPLGKVGQVDCVMAPVGAVVFPEVVIGVGAVDPHGQSC